MSAMTDGDLGGPLMMCVYEVAKPRGVGDGAAQRPAENHVWDASRCMESKAKSRNIVKLSPGRRSRLSVGMG